MKCPKTRTPRILNLAIAVLTLTSAPLAADSAFSKRGDVKVAMTDGTILEADVYVPSDGTAFPVVLVRTPYDRKSKDWLASALATEGYAVVLQDVRGMGGSQGRFIPFINEKADGLDTIDWVVAQPWCNGRVGMWGTSYLAYCALVVAPTRSPALKTIINLSGWGDVGEMTSPGGAMHLMLALPWTLSGQIRGKGSFRDFDWPDVFQRLPVVEIPKSLGINSAAWEGAVQMFTDDGILRRVSVDDEFEKIDIPILHITGWNDFVGRHTLDVFEGIKRAQDDTDRVFQKLIVGPWRHDQIWLRDARVGDEDFGQEAHFGMKKVTELTLRWFDCWLKGRKNGVREEPRVELFLMGENSWHRFDDWPPRGVDYQRWYVDSAGGANTVSGDGVLSPKQPTGDALDRFVYDPSNPVPTLGGANFHFFLDNLGVKDQRPVERRDDVLVYTSSPLEADMRIIGPLSAVVYASTEGRNTDFTAKLVEVRKDGYARIIEDGIRRGPDGVKDVAGGAMTPNKVYKFTIDLGATAVRIQKGNRLRLEISSSNFPKYTRNPNTGESPEYATEFTNVVQTVIHTAEHPTHVVLSVLD